MSDATAIEITTQGRTLRFGADVPDARGIPFGLTYASTMPGGHSVCAFNLRVPIAEEATFGLLDHVRVYAVKGNVTLWDGMVSRLPRQSGADVLLQVQCVGRSAEMSWQTGFVEVYADQNLSDWHDTPLWRRAALAAASNPQGKIPVSADAAGIVFDVPNEALTQFERTELWYEAPAGVKLALAAYIGERQGAFTNLDGPTLNATDQPEGAATIDTYSLSLTGAVQVATLSTPRRRVFLLVRVNTAVTPAAGHQERYTTFAVFGDHGLPTVSVFAEPYGYYGHHLLADIISRAAPGLNYTTGPDGSIQDNTSFAVQQLTFPKPTTAADALLELNKYFLWEWGVWDDGEFFWRPADPDRLCWEARLDEGIELQLEGDEADNALNGVLVNYRLPNGTEKVAGPVGSGFDVEDAALGDPSVDNTVNEHGIARKWAQLDLSFPTSDAGAVQIGFVYLAQLSFPARKGQITLTGKVKHPTKGMRPVGEVRAGDWIKIPGHSDVARRIVQASHTPDARQCSVDVGNDVEKVDAVLQRLGVRTSRITG